MKNFLESMDKYVWDAVVNRPFQPTKIENGKTMSKELSQWTHNKNKRARMM